MKPRTCPIFPPAFVKQVCVGKPTKDLLRFLVCASFFAKTGSHFSRVMLRSGPDGRGKPLYHQPHRASGAPACPGAQGGAFVRPFAAFPGRAAVFALPENALSLYWCAPSGRKPFSVFPKSALTLHSFARDTALEASPPAGSAACLAVPFRRAAFSPIFAIRGSLY